DLPADAAVLRLHGIHDPSVAQLSGPLTIWVALNGEPLGMALVMKPGPFIRFWPVPDGLRDRCAGTSCEVAITTAASLVASRFWSSADRRELAFRFAALSFDAMPADRAHLIDPTAWSATTAIERHVEVEAARMLASREAERQREERG